MLASLLKQLFGAKRPDAEPPVADNADACREALRAGRTAEAADCFRAYLASHPDDATAYNDFGVTLQRLQRYAEALACFKSVIRLTPADANAWHNAGVIYHRLGDLKEAESCYRSAISADPNDPEAHRGYSMLRLLEGDFTVDAWSSFRHRRRCAGFEPTITRCTAPLWNSEPVAGKSILVHGEQGLGDEILFASCFPDLVARAGRCLFETEPRLESLFRRSFPDATVMGRNREAELATLYPSIDYHAPCGDLPLHFRTSPAAFGGRNSYLKADAGAVQRWRAALAGLGDGLKVGISWRGGTPKNNQAGRSIGLDGWTPLFAVPGIRFVSLQYGDCGEDIAYARSTLGTELRHWPEVIADYDETAALVSALDLVVTVTTSVAHLAGALGQKAWILVNSAPRWCYLASGDTMPWYPSARLFRQQRGGGWNRVMNEVAVELERLRA